MQTVYAVATAVVAYFAIQSWDDSRLRSQGKEVASTGKRVALFFFLLMVCIIGGHFVSNGLSTSSKKSHSSFGGGDFELPTNEFLKRIPEEVHVGPPPF